MSITQGEWKVKKSESKPAFNVVGTVPGCKYKIARCPFIIIENSHEATEREMKEAEANAKLIAAAPELLEALQSIINWGGNYAEWHNINDESLRHILSVIKKATR